MTSPKLFVDPVDAVARIREQILRGRNLLDRTNIKREDYDTWLQNTHEMLSFTFVSREYSRRFDSTSFAEYDFGPRFRANPTGWECRVGPLLRYLQSLIPSDEPPAKPAQTLIAAGRLGDRLHHEIQSAAGKLFVDGHYANAVVDACKALCKLVQQRSGRDNLDGVALMRTVFSANAPILAFNEMKSRSDRDEQEGMMHLFEGTMLALRNPRAHTLMQDESERAREYVQMISLLAKRLDEIVPFIFISDPKYDAYVGQQQEVFGTIYPHSQGLQVLVRSNQQWHAQNPPQLDGGNWSALCFFGDANNKPGDEFEIVAIDERNSIDKQTDKLPDEALTSNIIKVVRK